MKFPKSIYESKYELIYTSHPWSEISEELAQDILRDGEPRIDLIVGDNRRTYLFLVKNTYVQNIVRLDSDETKYYVKKRVVGEQI